MVSDVFDYPVNSEKSICGSTSNIGTKCKLGGGGYRVVLDAESTNVY